MESHENWSFQNSAESIKDCSSQNRPTSNRYFARPIICQHCTVGQEFSYDGSINCPVKWNKHGCAGWRLRRNGYWIGFTGTGYYFFVEKWVKGNTLKRETNMAAPVDAHIEASARRALPYVSSNQLKAFYQTALPLLDGLRCKDSRSKCLGLTLGGATHRSGWC